MISVRMWLCLGLLGSLMLTGVSGCGDGAPFDIIPVTGKVTYEDGSLIPAARVVVSFNPRVEPLDKKTYPRPGAAEVNVKDGTFSEVTTWKYGDGVIAGSQKVTVESFDDMDSPTADVPQIYRSPDTTPLTAEVGSGSKEFTFTIKR